MAVGCRLPNYIRDTLLGAIRDSLIRSMEHHWFPGIVSVRGSVFTEAHRYLITFEFWVEVRKIAEIIPIKVALQERCQEELVKFSFPPIYRVQVDIFVREEGPAGDIAETIFRLGGAEAVDRYYDSLADDGEENLAKANNQP